MCRRSSSLSYLLGWRVGLDSHLWGGGPGKRALFGPLALKDVRLALSEADSASVPMPSVDVVHNRLIAGVARGGGGLDWSALALVAAEESGLLGGGLKGKV
jgi:hypothetical protein